MAASRDGYITFISNSSAVKKLSPGTYHWTLPASPLLHVDSSVRNVQIGLCSLSIIPSFHELFIPASYLEYQTVENDAEWTAVVYPIIYFWSITDLIEQLNQLTPNSLGIRFLPTPVGCRIELSAGALVKKFRLSQVLNRVFGLHPMVLSQREGKGESAIESITKAQLDTYSRLGVILMDNIESSAVGEHLLPLLHTFHIQSPERFTVSPQIAFGSGSIGGAVAYRRLTSGRLESITLRFQHLSSLEGLVRKELSFDEQACIVVNLHVKIGSSSGGGGSNSG